jgi:hypothetical protein
MRGLARRRMRRQGRAKAMARVPCSAVERVIRSTLGDVDLGVANDARPGQVTGHTSRHVLGASHATPAHPESIPKGSKRKRAMTQPIPIHSHPRVVRKIVIGRSPAGLPRTYRLERPSSGPARLVAFVRRMAA